MNYVPRPIDTSGAPLTADILELTEKLAKNTHEVWAKRRIAEGWKWGPKRNEETKEHPCLVEYDQLPEGEKQYDRNTAMETLKVILVLGYTISRE